MSKQLRVPAISREVEFIAQHTAEAGAVYDEEIRVPEAVKELTVAVYDRAEADVASLLRTLQAELSRTLQGLLRIRWVGGDLGGRAEGYGPIYNAHGRKKQTGWVGIYLGHYDMALRLFGWVSPKGGLDGRRKLARACTGKIKGVRVVSDHRKDYPEWVEDCVVWFDRKLTLKDTRDELRTEVGLCAKRFFKIANRYL